MQDILKNQHRSQLRPHGLNNKNLFIKGWYIDPSVCVELVNMFNCNTLNWEKGQVAKDEEKQIAEDYKQSTELTLNIFDEENEVIKNYHNQLKNVADLYVDTFPASVNLVNPWSPSPKVNIQRYLPGEGFHKFHSERSGGTKTANRHLVFMTYLNTIQKGGQTHFLHQDIKLQPEEGLTVIWPVDWTYTHKGLTTEDEIKYIITGWFDFL